MGDEVKNNLAIDIRAFRRDQDLWSDLLSLDLTHDGRLEAEDLEPIFGTALTQRYSAPLAAAAQSQNYLQLKSLIGKLNGEKLPYWTRLWSTFLPAGNLRSQGAHVDSSGHIDLSHADETQLRNIASSAVTAFHILYANGSRDELYRPPENAVNGMAHFLKDFDQSSFAQDSGTTLSYEGLARYYDETLYHDEQNLQELYVKEEAYELNQSLQLAALEKKHGIDLRVNFDINPIQLQHIDLALTELSRLSANDLPRLNKLSIAERDTPFLRDLHAEGATRPYSRHIILEADRVSPEVPSGKVRSVGGIYGRESVMREFPHYSPLSRVLAHEFGHLLYHESLISFYYEGKFSDRTLSGETFAEDYAFYLLSGGEQVMKRRDTGEPVPHYEERLALFNQHVRVTQSEPSSAPSMSLIMGNF